MSLEDGGKLIRDGGPGGDFARAQVCVTEVLHEASVVFIPCVVVENLFYRFLLALGEYVADVMKTSREAGVNLYLRGPGGGIVVGGWEGGRFAPQWSKQRDPGLGHLFDAAWSRRRRSGIGVVRCHVSERGDKLGHKGRGPQGGARLEALHDGWLVLGHIRVLGGEDLLEGEEVAV